MRGRAQQLELPRSRAVDFKAVAKQLIDRGFPTIDRDALAERLTVKLELIKPESVIDVVDRTGWFGPAFALPGAEIGANGGRLLYGGAASHPYSMRMGALDGWKRGLAGPLPPSLPHAFAMAAALAAPLLRFSGLPGDVAFLFTQEG